MEQTSDYPILIAKHLKGEISDAERAGLFEWVNSAPENKALYDDIEKLWTLTSTPVADYVPNVDEGWNELKAKMNSVKEGSATQPDSFKIIHLFTSFRVYKIAAVFLGLLGMAYLIFMFNKNENLEFATISKEQKQFMLPDSSIITLKENSTLSYAANFNEADRVVYLSGEAFFEVTKKNGKNFTIYGGNSKTVVLGTSFTIRAYKEEREVTITLNTGKVAFSSVDKRNKMVYLTPGEKASLSREDEIVKTGIRQEKDSWASKLGNMEFSDTHLDQVFEKMEAFYGVEIQVSDPQILKCRFTGTFLKCNVDKIMKVLTVSLNLTFEKDQNMYKISGQGCN